MLSYNICNNYKYSW